MKKTLLLGRATLLLVLAIMWGGDLMAQKTLPYTCDFNITSLSDEGWTTSGTPSTGTNIYTSSGHTWSGHTEVKCYRFSTGNGTYTAQYLISPELATSSTGLNLEFWYNGSNSHNIKIGYSTTNNNTTSFTWIDDKAFSSSSYTKYSTEIKVSGIKYIALFFYDNTGSWQSKFIDDVSIAALTTSCSAPTLSSTVVVSSTTASLSWTAGGEEKEWTLEYSTDEDFSVPANITTIDDLTTASKELTELTDGTTYYARVKANCSESEESDWSKSVSFTTLCTESIPYSYGFEDTDELDCWTLKDTHTNTTITTAQHNSGSNSFYFFSSSANPKQYLITPELSGTEHGVHVEFYIYSTLTSAKFHIGYSTTDHLIESFTWYTENNPSKASEWLLYSYNCPENTKFIAVKFVQTLSLYIDDIALTVPTYNPSDGNWNSTSSWSNGAVPTSSSDIVISSDITIPSGCSASANTLLVGEGSLTIASGGTLTITNRIDNTIAANLVIEDGGQLITSSTGVAATVQKDITASTAKSGEGWYTIASAVNNPAITSGTNLTDGTYDLYRFEESEQEKPWENYKAHSSTDFTTLENGRGYLYRNGANKTLSFTGDINVGNVSYSVTNSGGDFAGFNLIGNPYPHNIYKGAGTAIPNYSGSTLNTGFYTLTNEGAWSTGTDNSTAILPGQGIMVEATKAGTLTILDKTSSSGSKYNSEYIRFTVENAEYSDDAYAWFDKGYGLHKIDHRNPAIPMLYIPKDGEDYSIAIMKDNTEAFGLNFKANTTGSYTLKYKSNGNFDYLHVIDRMTGEDTDMLLDGEYSFVGSTQDDEARFIVKLAYKPNYGSSDETVFAYQSGSEIFVSGEGELQVFDVTGRIVSTETINGVKAVSVPAQGVYVFRLVGENVKTQKIVVR